MQGLEYGMAPRSYRHALFLIGRCAGQNHLQDDVPLFLPVGEDSVLDWASPPPRKRRGRVLDWASPPPYKRTSFTSYHLCTSSDYLVPSAYMLTFPRVLLCAGRTWWILFGLVCICGGSAWTHGAMRGPMGSIGTNLVVRGPYER